MDTLVRAALSPPEPTFTAACRLVTGGNPFLLVELLAELGAAGVAARAAEVDRIAAVVVPRGVQRAVLARLRGLPGSAAALARAAAVLGDGADPRRGARLVGLGETGLGETGLGE